MYWRVCLVAASCIALAACGQTSGASPTAPPAAATAGAGAVGTSAVAGSTAAAAAKPAATTVAQAASPVATSVAAVAPTVIAAGQPAATAAAAAAPTVLTAGQPAATAVAQAAPTVGAAAGNAVATAGAPPAGTGGPGGVTFQRPVSGTISGAQCDASNQSQSPGVVGFGFPTRDVTTAALAFSIGPIPGTAGAAIGADKNPPYTGAGSYTNIGLGGKTPDGKVIAGIGSVVVNADEQTGTFALSDNSASGTWDCGRKIPRPA